MTSLPPHALPPGSHADGAHLRYPGISSDLSSSVISPLTLPRGATGYFDYPSASATSHPAHARKARAGRVYSPLSPAVLPHFLSPHLTPITREVQHHLNQQRSVSLSPTRGMASADGAHRVRSMVSPPSSVPSNGAYADASQIPNTSVPPLSSMSLGHPRSASADAAGAASQTQMMRRLVQQNGRIREAWEAERKYMEANRERAEEVYKEERALMEEERAEWEEEKAVLVQQIELLEQQVLSLGGDTRLVREGRIASVNGAAIPGPTLRIDGGVTELEERAWSPSDSALPSQANGPAAQRNGATVGSGVASRGTRSAASAFQPMTAAAAAIPPLQTDLLGPIQERVTPPKQHDLSTFIPQPAMVPLPPSSTDSMASPDHEDLGPIPIVDIQEIHPELEGIPIKAPAVQKPTFTDNPSPSGSRSSSSASSPSPGGAKISKPKRPGKEHTLQLLAADVSDRLTMHAGHTPNHSLSLLPTAVISQVTTASSSGESTPTLHQGDDQTVPTSTEDASRGVILQHAPELAELDATSQFDKAPDHPEPILEPVDDIELKGPLMVRNMPAHDEIFFRKLSDKLEEVSKGDNAALPAVLKDLAGTGGASEQDKAENHGDPAAGVEASVDGAASSDSNKGSSNRSPKEKGGDEEELDIPLKLKRSNNFGAPFGEFR